MSIELFKKCACACREGADFPTVWHTLLKGNPLVAGIPRQRLDGPRALLEVPLISGYCLVYDSDSKEFDLEWGGI